MKYEEFFVAYQTMSWDLQQQVNAEWDKACNQLFGRRCREIGESQKVADIVCRNLGIGEYARMMDGNQEYLDAIAAQDLINGNP